MRLTEHATALGRHGAKRRWQDTSAAERKRIMALVRAAKKRKREQASDNYGAANAGLISEALR
jgi:hypothetical protein